MRGMATIRYVSPSGASMSLEERDRQVGEELRARRAAPTNPVRTEPKPVRTAATPPSEPRSTAMSSIPTVPPNPAATNGVHVRQRIDPGESSDDRRKGLGDFLKCLAMRADPRVPPREQQEIDARLRKVYGTVMASEHRALSSTKGTAGGYLLPPSLRAEVLMAAREVSVVRPRAKLVAMDALEVPIPALDAFGATSAGSSPFYGSFTPTWAAEGATIVDQSPKFQLPTLRADRLIGSFSVPNNLLRASAVSVDPLARTIFGNDLAWVEDQAFLSGNGVGKPLGVKNSPASITTAARGSATAITFANARAAWTRVLPSSRSRCVWLASQGAEDKVLDMATSSNAFFANSTAVDPGEGAPFGILHRPVFISEHLPALNALVDFGCYDFSYYLIGDPGLTEVAASGDFEFNLDVTRFRLVHYVGGMPWPSAPITLSDGSTTVSPFVALGPQ